MPLKREVLAEKPPEAVSSGWVIQFDASTTGGGAVLRAGDKIVEYVLIKWNNSIAEKWDVRTGDSKHQSFWEFLMLLISLMLWGSSFGRQSVAVVGDNTGSLTLALSLKAKGSMAAIARDIAWRR